MEIEFRKEFLRLYKKLPHTIRTKFDERLKLYITSPHHPLLYVHTITGADYPIQTFNITRDDRAQFIISKNVIALIKISTNGALY